MSSWHDKEEGKHSLESQKVHPIGELFCGKN